MGPGNLKNSMQFKTIRQNAGKSARTDGTVQSIIRAFSLLEFLAANGEGCRLTDLARGAGLSPSTVHRLLTTMEQQHFVQFDRSSSLWHIGRQCYSVGSAYVRNKNFVVQALPFLRRLRDQTRETVNLGVAEEGEIVILTQVESREIMRAITRAGGRASMTSSGLGKAISATYSTEDVSAIIRRHGMMRMTPKSIVKANEFDKELKRIRLQGYAIDDEEVSMGLRCVAAVIYDDHSEVLAAISASGPTTRIPNERIAQLGKIVTDAANEITFNLGGRLPK